MSPLFAETINLGPTSMMSAVAGAVAGALLIHFMQRFNAQKQNPVATQAVELAVHAENAQLGPLARLVNALVANDKATISAQIAELHRYGKEGRLAKVFEDFTHRQIRELLKDPTDRQELLGVISAHEGENVEKLLEQTKLTKNVAAAARPLVPMLILAALLAIGAAPAMAAGPERFEPTDRSAVVEPPVFSPKRDARTTSNRVRPKGGAPDQSARQRVRRRLPALGTGAMAAAPSLESAVTGHFRAPCASS
ncbi:MAG: hypothetical protein M3Q42_11885 [Pseudomonadota bacterium]|nr:hypothetical protein [Pseudomonadota bacterium]